MDDIKRHPWFSDISWTDWPTLGPIVPKEAPLGDTSNYPVDDHDRGNSPDVIYTGDPSIFEGF